MSYKRPYEEQKKASRESYLTMKNDPRPKRIPTDTCNGRIAQAKFKEDPTRDYCKNPAGWGTSHYGSGRCKWHGGCNPNRYDRFLRNRSDLGNLMSEFQDEGDALNILPELAAMRALFVDFIDRYEAWAHMISDWHASYEKGYDDREKKPTQIMDIKEGNSILDQIVRAASVARKAIADTAIPREQFMQIMTELGNIIDTAITDDNMKTLSADRMKALIKGAVNNVRVE